MLSSVHCKMVDILYKWPDCLLLSFFCLGRATQAATDIKEIDSTPCNFFSPSFILSRLFKLKSGCHNKNIVSGKLLWWKRKCLISPEPLISSICLEIRKWNNFYSIVHFSWLMYFLSSPHIRYCSHKHFCDDTDWLDLQSITSLNSFQYMYFGN